MKKSLPYRLGVLALVTITGWPSVGHGQTANAVSLFDGKTLDGWIDAENSASAFDGGSVIDWPAFAKKITDKTDPVSAFLNEQLDDTNRENMAAFSPTDANARAVKSAFAKGLNKIISGSAIYDASRFQNVQLRSETKELLAKNPSGLELIRLNKILIEDAYPAVIAKSSLTGWTVKDGVLASTGAGRGVLYTKGDYNHFRLLLTMRHVSGKPEHPAAVLFFCTRPKDGEKPLDALAGIQFMIPEGLHWDYRPGHGNDGGKEFTSVVKGNINAHEWCRVEILVDATKGTARLAVAQPLGAKAVELLQFNLPEAGKAGPIALQMHNGGLFDEYKEITVEVDPKVDDLITVK
jgi:hypothetical protein